MLVNLCGDEQLYANDSNWWFSQQLFGIAYRFISVAAILGAQRRVQPRLERREFKRCKRADIMKNLHRPGDSRRGIHCGRLCL